MESPPAVVNAFCGRTARTRSLGRAGALTCCARSPTAARASRESRSIPSLPTPSCATVMPTLRIISIRCPQVHLHVGDGRSFIRNAKEQYDVVQMTLVDTWASTAAGAFALSENSLYTTQAFREYFDHLKPDGMIAVTRWEFRQPREALRVVSVAMEALHHLGVADTSAEFHRGLRR